MTEFLLSLKIDKVGDREALNALNDLDKKGRAIVEGVSAATGKALGEVAVAYERGSASVKRALDDIAQGHRQNIKEIEAEQRAQERASSAMASSADSLARRQGNATLAATRGVEQIVRSAQATGSALDTVLAQTSQLAFGFGATGPIVGAIGVATIAVVDLFRKAAEESKKLINDVAKQFERINQMDVRAQGEAAALLYNGNPFAANAAERFGIKNGRAEKARLEAVVAAGTFADPESGVSMTADAERAAEALKTIEERLKTIEPLYASIVGVQGRGGSLERAGIAKAAEDKPGFTTDAMKEGEKARKKAEAEQGRLLDAAAKQALEAYNHLAKEQESEYKRTSEETVREFEKSEDEKTAIAIQQANEQSREEKRIYKETLAETEREVKESRSRASSMDLAGLREAINHSVSEGGVYLDDAIEALTKMINTALTTTLRGGVIAGLEAAFSGKGIGNVFESLTATVLAGLGSFMEQLGAQMLVVGLALDAFSAALLMLDGPAAIAAGVALIAAGAGLKAIAGSFGGHGAGGGSGGGGYSGGGMPQIIDRGIINPDSHSDRQASTIPAKASVTNNVTIIGPNDASAQRAWDELQRKSLQRGSLAGVG